MTNKIIGKKDEYLTELSLKFEQFHNYAQIVTGLYNYSLGKPPDRDNHVERAVLDLCEGDDDGKTDD